MEDVICPPNTEIKPAQILPRHWSIFNFPHLTPPRSDVDGVGGRGWCKGSAGGKSSSLAGVARFFKDGGNRRYRLFVPLSLQKQIYDVGDVLFGKKKQKNGQCP